MQRCWDHDPSSRPQAPEVLKVLTLSLCKLLTAGTLTLPERNRVIMSIFSDRDHVKMVEYVSGRHAQEFVDIIDEVSPGTTRYSANKLIDKDSNPRVLLHRHWKASRLMYVEAVCSLYTGFAAVLVWFHNHWCFRSVTTRKGSHCAMVNLPTYGKVFTVAGRLPSMF